MRLALLVRLASLVVAVGGLIGQQLTVQTFVAILLLGGVSAAALLQPAFLDQLTRHPMLATADVAIVVAVFAVSGVDSPLALAALSTAFLIGLIYPVRISALLGPLLALAYAGTAINQHRDDQAPFLLIYGLPVTFLCLVWIGHSVNRIYSAQRDAEQKLAAFVQASVVQDERSRLAREMHDSLAKSLQGIAFGAAALPSWVERDLPRAQQEAAELAQNANQAVQEARTLLTRMRTDEPLKPFEEVLEDVVGAWASHHDRSVRLDLRPVQGLDSDARYELLAAVREALENVRRHAPDAEVLVRTHTDAENAELLIADAGPGFDQDDVSRRETEGHFGLRGMRERLREIGGEAEIRSRPGAGTTVLLRAPLRGADV